MGFYNVSFFKNKIDYDRVVTGSEYYPSGRYGGKVYVFYGGSPMDSVVDVWMVGKTDSSSLGYWSSGVGEADSNNYGEFMSTARGDSIPASVSKGVDYLWLGSAIMDTIEDGWLAGCAYRVCCAGDVNGDGKDEVMMSGSSGPVSL
ncbi:MAG: hypothetical protein AB1393_06625 [Candidatus Edwardsbacteria bacterium]